jgi:hypothetical protein
MIIFAPPPDRLLYSENQANIQTATFAIRARVLRGAATVALSMRESQNPRS